MLEQIIDAINIQDYPTAYQLIAQFKQQEPDNPWITFFIARLAEASGNLTLANESYHQLLPNLAHPKLISQVRQGIQRITEIEATQQKEALAQVLEEAGSLEMGMLVLEAISPDLKQRAAQNLGKIMEIDPYSARLLLPSRSWRLYRTGSMGKLRFYRDRLNQTDIPCFTVSV